MRFHDTNIFASKSLTPCFTSLSSLKDVIFHIHSGSTERANPEINIFFANQQEAVNFKNAVIQSWETFLKKEAKKKS